MTSYPALYFGSAMPIVNQTNSGVNSLVAQVASGGGSNAGPNLQVSSLAVAPGGPINLGANGVAGGAYLNLEYDTVSNASAFIAFQVASGADGFLQMYYDPATSSIYTNFESEVGGFFGPGGHSMAFANISSLNVSSINGAVPGGASSIPPAGISTNQIASASGGTLLMLGDANNAIAIDPIKGIGLQPNLGTGLIELNAYSTIITHDLNVSSINGQAPGSAGSASTFTSLQTNQLYTSSIGVADPLANDLIIAGRDSFIVLDMTSGLLSQIGFALSTSVTEFIPQAVNISAFDLGNNDYLLDIGRPGGAAKITTSISSLSVSSINGVAPGGGSALQFSTISIPGGSGISSFVLSAGTTNNLVAFSTTAGHVYQASVVARASSGPVADDDSILSEIVDSVAGNEVIGSWPLSQVSSLSGSSFLQQIGGSITWKAGGTGAFFSLYPTATASARVDGINLIDFGAI